MRLQQILKPINIGNIYVVWGKNGGIGTYVLCAGLILRQLTTKESLSEQYELSEIANFNYREVIF